MINEQKVGQVVEKLMGVTSWAYAFCGNGVDGYYTILNGVKATVVCISPMGLKNKPIEYNLSLYDEFEKPAQSYPLNFYQ